MNFFCSLSLAPRVRLFLIQIAALSLLAMIPGSSYGQFKFREPVNRQTPKTLETLDGQRLWNRFQANREIGKFEVEGLLVTRPAGKPSQSMEFFLGGDWINGMEQTRLLLSKDGRQIVHSEVHSGHSETTIKDLTKDCPKAEIPEKNFFTGLIHEGLPLTWDDVLMPFLHWESYSYMGPSRYLGRPAHRFEVFNPESDVFPAKVVLTLDADFAALLQVELFDVSGSPVRRIRVGGFKQFGEAWMFSELNWENRKSRDSVRLSVSSFTLLP